MSAADRLAAMPARANVFAALGDPTRLGLVAALADGAPRSISALSAGTALTRQGVTKHLRVLEEAGVVIRQRAGRETLFGLDHKALADVEADLAAVARQWDDALARLRTFVET